MDRCQAQRAGCAPSFYAFRDGGPETFIKPEPQIGEFAGRIAGERGPDATEGELGLLMAGVTEGQEAAE